MDDWLGDTQPMAQDMSQSSFRNIESNSQALQGQHGKLNRVSATPGTLMPSSCIFRLLIRLGGTDVDEDEVINRIESCILAFLEEVFHRGAAPDISLVSS